MNNRVMFAAAARAMLEHRLRSGSGSESTAPGAGGASRPPGTVLEPLERRRLLSGYNFAVLASFEGVNSAPESGVILDDAGNLYGTTYFGGTVNSNEGAVFEIPKGSSTITTLAAIDGTNGAFPVGRLTFDADGNLYGTTAGNRGADLGTVFEIPKGGDLVTLARFNGNNGANPVAGVTLDPAGNLYGTTEFGGIGFSGGQTGAGTVFEILKGSQTVTTLASFNGANGSDLFGLGGLAMDAAGNLFGTTLHGGVHDLGTVFEIAKGSNTPTTLVSFDGANGEYPSDLILGADGNLYGTTFGVGFGGGDNAGTVFEIKKGSTEITTLASFNDANGRAPSGLTLDAAGNLYGTTQQGGPQERGTVFEVAKGSNAITVLHTFEGDGTNGDRPRGRVTLDSDGNLYGTTVSGGAHNRGTVFELSPRQALTVTQVFVNGQGLTGQTSANGEAFRRLAGIDTINGYTYGYSVPAGTAQTKSIPWSNGINQIGLRFSEDVASILQQGDLVVRGVNNANYRFSSFGYDPATKTAVWTLSAPVTNDKLRLVLDDALVDDLDGEWQNSTAGESYPSGDGTPGGDFNFRINVLRGDANGDGTVNALDVAFVRARLNKTATDPGTTGAVYSPFADVNADGVLNALDLAIGKQRLNGRLPTGEPAGATALLFSSRAITR